MRCRCRAASENGRMWWLAHGEHDVPPSLEWLSPNEREHLASIRFTKRRNEYLTRRWTAKQAIATVLTIDRTSASLTRIEVRHRPSGAPYVHLDGRAAAVVGDRGRCGEPPDQRQTTNRGEMYAFLDFLQSTEADAAYVTNSLVLHRCWGKLRGGALPPHNRDLWRTI